MRLRTVGHADRSLGELVELLLHHGVDRVADVRRYPASRAHPWFNRGDLEASLPDHGIAYGWFEDLGGRVGRQGDVPEGTNDAWENDGFRNYADHALTSTWQAALSELLEWSRGGDAAIMCAERVWWRCHRRIIADHLAARGHEVEHLIEEDRVMVHELSEFAEVRGDGCVVYPG